ncbi:MAG: hypothetical protein JSC189_001298 [Candidatus Tokpelaia sp. JSC189]|nr:MAG: hypothetical protein JSC189_001298 [Candidatus Tokpelaia sp. JSC189]
MLEALSGEVVSYTFECNLCFGGVKAPKLKNSEGFET